MLKVLLLTCLTPDKKIQAIKEVRTATGLGLKEAKTVVDTLIGGSVVHGQSVTIEVEAANLDILRDRFTFEVLSNEAVDPSRLALRAALIGVPPDTLESLGLALPPASPTRVLLDEAAALMRSLGATSAI